MGLTTWTDVIQGFVTKIKATHILELRTAVNGAESALDSHTAHNQRHLNVGSAGGSSNAYTVNVSTVTGLAMNMLFVFVAPFANTGACTLNVNGLGSRAMKIRGDADVPAGYIKANQAVLVLHDGTYYQILSVSALNPTTLAGYGITDAVPKSGNTTISGVITATGFKVGAADVWHAANLVPSTTAPSSPATGTLWLDLN